MTFEDKLSNFVQQIAKRKAVIKTEEATKTSLVLPFLGVLGYDFTNPLEVHPEFNADFGVKKSEKIDYAIIKDDKPIIFIECKMVNANIDDKKCCSQLFRYFSVGEASVGILTNGTQYRFYSDIKNENKMDNVPFLSVDLENLKPEHIIALKKFCKDEFDVNTVVQSAEGMMIQNELLKALEAELDNPSDIFEDILIRKVYAGKITQSVRSKYSPKIRDAIKTYISDRVTSRLQSALNTEIQERVEVVPEPESDGIVTTEEEIIGFHMIQAIASRIVSPDRVHIRDAKSYCAVLLDNNNRKTICRLYFNSPTIKHLATFDEGGREVKNQISGVNDIYQYQDQICATIQSYLK